MKDTRFIILIMVVIGCMTICIIWLTLLTAKTNSLIYDMSKLPRTEGDYLIPEHLDKLEIDTLSVERIFVHDYNGIDRIGLGTDRYSVWLWVEDSNHNRRLDYEDFGDGKGGYFTMYGQEGKFHGEIRLDTFFFATPMIHVSYPGVSTDYTPVGEVSHSNAKKD